MNREEIFRGKLSHSGEWVFGSLLKIGSHYHIVTESDMYEDGHHICQESDTPTWVDPDTVGEFTGMRDKHGKKIFEGDVVEVTSIRYGYEDFKKKMLCEIVYDDDLCCFDFRASDLQRCMCATIPDAKIKVIGNVYDNSELLSTK